MSSDKSQPPQRRQSTNTLIKQDDKNDLSGSLKRLSLSNHSAAAGSSSPRVSSRSATSPLVKAPSRHSSPTSARRVPSRSPSATRGSRSETPTLLRKASTNSLRSANGGAAPPQPSSRRSSFAQNRSPNVKEEEKQPLTPESLAHGYFQAELETHHGPVATFPTDLVVILHDAVYGHRFARPRTSKQNLSTIVERPERIKAAVLGVSSAYVRLGGRHSDGALPPHPKRNMHSLPSIPFRIQKSTRRVPLTSAAVTNVHGTKWMDELKSMCETAEAKLAMGGKELQRPERVRSPDQPRPEKLHEGDLYLCAESLEAMEGALGAVCDAVDTVFGSGPKRAFVGVRPPGHHCSAAHPSGFCWVNNVHVGIMHAGIQHGLTHAAIIDFDLHHGDGSQDITWNHNAKAAAAKGNVPAWKKTSIGYFSLHDINSYPCESGDVDKVKNASLCIDNAHGQSVWNVHLELWKDEEEFWHLYESKYKIILEKTRSYLEKQANRLRALGQEPKAAIFFSAGFDASQWEMEGMQRHQVNVPTEFYARLSQDVIGLAAEHGLGVEGRVVSVLEGGYSDRALCSGVFSHLSGLVSTQATQATLHETGGLGYDMSQKMGVIHDEEVYTSDPRRDSVHSYDPTWWSRAELERLESKLATPEAPLFKPRKSGPPSYSSPTNASTAKVVEPSLRLRRSLSNLSSGKAPSRPPSPPPPEVSWMTAAHELSELLIPSQRQVDSYKAEELNAEATRVRREKQAVILGLSSMMQTPKKTEVTTPRMALRDRRTRPASSHGEEAKEFGTATRRRPAAANSSGGTTPAATPIRRTSRRLSGAHTVLDTTSEVGSNDAGSSRSGSSQTARPIAERAQSETTVPGRKARAVTTPAKKETMASRATRGGRVVSSARSTPAAARTKQTAPDSSPAGDDVDQLTKGMRKIKINLVTQSQKDARERARLEAGKASSKPAASGQIKTEPTNTEAVTEQPKDISLTTIVVAEKPQHDGVPVSLHPTGETQQNDPITPITPSGPEFAVDTPQQASSSPVTSNSEPAPPLPPPQINEPDFFIPYQPEGPEPVSIPQQETLKWLPPNNTSTPIATPSPVKKDNLFHYTPGAIPFAPRGVNERLELKPQPRQEKINGITTPNAHTKDISQTPSKQA